MTTTFDVTNATLVSPPGLMSHVAKRLLKRGLLDIAGWLPAALNVVSVCSKGGVFFWPPRKPKRLACSLLLISLFEQAAWADVPTSGENEHAPRLPWTIPAGQGVGVGLEVFGASTATGAQASVIVPFGWLFALRGRAVVIDGFGDDGGSSVGLKIEGLFRSRVLLNFIRVYGGFGPAMFYGLTGAHARQVDGNWFAGDINGNWFGGNEIFFDPCWSLHWELGTSGGAFATGAGAYIDVGVNAYLF